MPCTGEGLHLVGVDSLRMYVISYGRVDELVYYAGLKEQYETLIHHFVEVVIQSSDLRIAALLLFRSRVQ